MALPKHLIALSPGKLQCPREYPAFLNGLEGALEAGLPAVLLREPLLGAWDFLRLAEDVRELCEKRSAGADVPKPWLGVHDSVHIALRIAADGVHLGYKSMASWEVRDLVGDSMAIGFSSHATDEPTAWRAADYLFHGPVYATPSKEAWLEPIGTEALGSFCAKTDLPVYGLGGIGPQQVREILPTGAGVAVLRGILSAKDPASATATYLEAIETVNASKGSA